MSAILCPIFVPCQPCPDGDPSFNISAELPDLERFFSIVHFYDTPPLGGSWQSAGCVQICSSTISQEDADLCALRLAQQCTWGGPGGSPSTGWRTAPTIGHPNGSLRTVFMNSEQTCSVACGDGSAFDFVTPAGLILSIHSQAEADEKARNYACQQAEVQQICLGDVFPNFACQNTFYEGSIVVTGEGLDDTNDWSIVAGAVPPGLTFHGGEIAGGEAFIDGNPTTLGVFSFTVQVESDSGVTEKTMSITVGGISTPSALPDATAGTPYSQALVATGMVAPITFSVLVGPLPDGLTLDPDTGILSGTPTTSGVTAFTISASDSTP